MAGEAARPACPPFFRWRGEQHYRAKLTEAAVRRIRAAYAAGGIAQWALGEQYGVDAMTIGRVVRRRTWRHVV